MDIKALKRALRGEALARRDALGERWRIEASLAMADRAREIDLAPGDIVSGFWPMRSEVDVRPLMFALMERGARLVDMGFGTSGPGPEAAVLEPTLMLVPLAAFDDRGHRIGYGAGYYDRAIARLQAGPRPPRLIGIAFECQRVERVPDQPHDIVIPEFLTELGLRRLAPAPNPAP